MLARENVVCPVLRRTQVVRWFFRLTTHFSVEIHARPFSQVHVTKRVFSKEGCIRLRCLVEYSPREWLQKCSERSDSAQEDSSEEQYLEARPETGLFSNGLDLMTLMMEENNDVRCLCFSKSKLERIFFWLPTSSDIFSNCSKIIFWKFQTYSLHNSRKFEKLGDFDIFRTNFWNSEKFN